MLGIGEILLACFLIYWAITRIFPQFLRWFIKRCYHVEARIGRIGIPYLSLHEVYFNANGYAIEIDQIKFRSSFFTSEVTKFLCVVINDIRINKDMGSQSSGIHWELPDSLKDVQIPSWVITVAQFVSVSMGSVTGAVVRNQCVFHCTLSDVQVDASVVHSLRTLLVTLSLGSVTARLLKQSAQPYLAHIETTLSAEATIVATKPLSIQNMSIVLTNLKTVINDEFLSHIGWMERKSTSKYNDKPNQYYSYNDIISYISPLIPKELTIKFDDCVFTGSVERDMTTLKKLHVITTCIPVSTGPDLVKLNAALNILIEDFDMQTEANTHLILHQLMFDASLEEKHMRTKLCINTFTSMYDYSKIQRFLNFLSEKSKHKSRSGQWWPDFEIEASVELRNVSSAVNIPNLLPQAVMGFTHFKLCYDSHLLFSSDICEIMAESVWCQLHQAEGFSVENLKREHAWGSPLYLGLFLLKQDNSRLYSKLDVLRLEWSPPLADILTPILLNLPKPLGWNKSADAKIIPPNCKFSVNVSLSSANIFFMADKKVCLMMRVDSSSIESSSWPNNVSLLAEGTKFSSITPANTTFVCLRSKDIKGWYGNVEVARMEWHRLQRSFLIKLSRQIQFVWSPNLHLKVMEMCSHLNSFCRTVNNGGKHLNSSREQKYEHGSSIQVLLKGHVKGFLKLSKQHYVTFETDDFSYCTSPTECIWASSILNIAVNAAEIFTIEAIQFETLKDSELVRTERANSEGFILPWNRTWAITMRSIKAIFPYEHQFSAAIQDDFVSVFKWFKRLHKSPNSTPKKLPPDLIIKVKEFIFEMSDDPFEVRLRDNYELLVDEYTESLKRQKMLDAKISQFCKTQLLLPAGKVDELYANLSSMNAQIYIQRSKQIQQQGTRSRLFAWIVTDLQIVAMTDPSINGIENVISNMTQIDSDTPWPEDGVEFTTLWCRSVVINCRELKFQLRDFPQPWLDLRQLQMWGRLVGAEQLPTRRAKRTVTLELGEPWGTVDIERSMTTLKFYHDLNCEVEHIRYAFGPCWEPVIAQCNLSFEKIMRPSLDPSPPLPLWDKLRLLLHGRVTMLIRQLTVLLHASLDPYNTTEEMEITWSTVAIDWTNAKVVFKGDLDIYVRTASKYDDCRLVHLPNLRLSVKLGWVCLGDPNDHHSVMPCAPDKLPDYSSNQEHDSFRAFRSQNLNISLALETKPVTNSGTEKDYPVALLYGSTLRWFENLKLILSGVTRPTRRGTVFKTKRPRKIPLSRHYRRVHLLLSLHSFQVHYWMSFAMQRGLELTGECISFSSEHLLSLVPIADGLKHRPRAEWSVVYMTCEVHNAEIWLRSALPDDQCEEKVSMRSPVEKCYFLSVGKVSYGREGSGQVSVITPTHRLVVYSLKGAWTMSNRDVVFALYDTFIKTKQLKKNLSTEALKGFRGETNIKTPAHLTEPQTTQQGGSANIQATPSPMSKLQCGHAATMLQQLIAEVDTKAVVFSDEPASSPSEQPLQGLAACQHTDDVIHKNWLIALVNSQVLLKGPETKGYVIISAAKAEILQRVHRPVWRDRTLVTKTTWVGSLQSMQYYATVNAGENDSLDESIMWLSVDNIREKDDCVIAGLPDVPQLVGSGQSVGGVVSETVGASSVGDNPPLQLQRIVSRCKCEFFYVCYGESGMSPSTLVSVPAPPLEDSSSLWEHAQPPVDAFTLMHHDLDVCTNSLQYAMLLDVVNNLLLYVEPSRREAYERLQRMRFQLQLQSVEDQRRPIQGAQTRVRGLLSKLRGLEREMYLVQRALGDEPDSQHLALKMDDLERQVYKCKETLNDQSMELDMMLSCYKETQLMANQKLATLRGDKSVNVVRANEICFKHAQWRLTEADGQLGIADLVLSNFLYTKNSKSDDSVEHLLELGYVRMTNLLPNQIYKEVLQPTEIHNNMPVDRKKAVRVFCRERAPVGGIPVKEHFEINVVPLTIGLTKKFYNTMLKFCFPEREADESEMGDDNEGGKKSRILSKGKETNFYVPIERKDDVEKMKERAEKNKQFTYIKIPEVPVKVSYKGNKEKNLEDIRDFSLVIPTLEYHNVTWTWLDLLLAMKSDSRKVILSQAIKQKLQIKMNRGGTEEGTSPQEEDKVKILFGSTHMPGESKSLKRGIFKFQK